MLALVPDVIAPLEKLLAVTVSEPLVAGVMVKFFVHHERGVRRLGVGRVARDDVNRVVGGN